MQVDFIPQSSLQVYVIPLASWQNSCDVHYLLISCFSINFHPFCLYTFSLMLFANMSQHFCLKRLQADGCGKPFRFEPPPKSYMHVILIISMNMNEWNIIFLYNIPIPCLPQRLNGPNWASLPKSLWFLVLLEVAIGLWAILYSNSCRCSFATCKLQGSPLHKLRGWGWWYNL